MKIMIIDDEPLVRVGMRSIIPWEKEGYRIVGEASDGKEAITIAAECRPDIILVDIILPEMNGLEFIKEIKEQLPLSKFIILSNREDLDFYRRAITLGVSDYIVKSSIQPEDILKRVKKVSKDIRKERVFENQEDDILSLGSSQVILNEYLNHVLNGTITDEKQIKEKLQLHYVDFVYSSLFMIVLDKTESERDVSQEEISRNYSFLGVLNEIVKDVVSGVAFRTFEGNYAIIAGIPAEEPPRETVDYLALRIHETIKQLYDEVVTLGVSEKIPFFHLINRGYNQAKIALENTFFGGKGETFYYENKADSDSNLSREVHESLATILSCKNLVDISKEIELVKKIALNLSVERSITKKQGKELFARILYHFIELAREVFLEEELRKIVLNPYDIIESAFSLKELENSVLCILLNLKGFLELRHSDSMKLLVDRVNQYIEEHYDEKIHLDDISRSINFSPSYISRIYKKKTGLTVRDRIVAVKIERSKEMLLENSTLAFIAEALNFSSESHFIKVFKECTGNTPGCYIKKTRSS